MKIKLLVLVLFALTSFNGFGQFSFGVSPGFSLNSAYFGYKKGKIVPYIGFQYFKASVIAEIKGQRYDWDIDDVVSYSEDGKVSVGLYVPNIGMKYFFIQRNKLQAYGNLCLSKPILGGKQTIDGEEDEDFKETLKNVSLFGGELSFGMEYFFDENFSIGGEFGLRYIHFKYKDVQETTIYNPNIGDYQDSQTTFVDKLNINPTFSKITLNFYF